MLSEFALVIIGIISVGGLLFLGNFSGNLFDRQKDVIRNSVTMLANYYASHKSLIGKKVNDRHEVIRAAGDDWNKHPLRFRRGAAVYRVGGVSNGAAIDHDTLEFTKDRGYLKRHVLRHWADEETVS